MPESGDNPAVGSASLWRLPSHFCLDAPLVAVSWSLLLGIRLGGPLSPLPHLGLGLAVWAVYLFDRIYDTRPEVSPPRTTARHRFARRHRRAMMTLLGVAIAGGLALAPWLLSSRKLLVGAAWVGLGVAGYYGCFRFLPIRGGRKTTARETSADRQARNFPPLPWKEAAVATCFTAGIALAAELSPAHAEASAALAGFWLLALGNCLFISREEAHEDRLRDPVAFFAGDGERGNRHDRSLRPCALLAPPLLALIAGPFALWLGAGLAVTAVLVLSAGWLLSLVSLPIRWPAAAGSPQALADAALFFPPVIALGCSA